MQVAEFQKYQYAFTKHLRNPEKYAKPEGIENRRMAIYSELLFNNIRGFIENGFPVLHSLYTEEAWTNLIRNFFEIHESHTPYFMEISQEFLLFLQNEYETTAQDPAFLLELAHYEWVELDLMISKAEINLKNIDQHGDLLAAAPAISPLVTTLAYQWDVQHISIDYQPENPPEQPTYLVVYRDKEDDVKFIEANPITARLIALIQEKSKQSGRQLLKQIAEEIQHPDPDLIIQGGHQILLKLQKSGVILGTEV